VSCTPHVHIVRKMVMVAAPVAAGGGDAGGSGSSSGAGDSGSSGGGKHGLRRGSGSGGCVCDPLSAPSPQSACASEKTVMEKHPEWYAHVD
jgi:hypothetical protein